MSSKVLQKNIPNEWNSTELGLVCDITMGQSPSSENYNQDQIGLPFFQGKADFTEDLSVKIRQWTSEITKESKPGDILMSVRAPVGDVAINNAEACIGRGLTAIRAKKNISEQQFIFQVLQYLKDELNKKAQGSTFTAINGPSLKKIQINLPPLSEQKKIAEILSSVDEEVKKFEEIISASEKLKSGVMQKLLTCGIDHTKFKKTKLGDIPETWKVKNLGDICDVRDGTHSSPKYHQGGVPLITSKNLVDDSLDFANINLISEEDYLEIEKRSHVDDGDILFGMIGTIGSPVIVRKRRDFAIKNLALVKFNQSNVNNEFILNFLKSEHTLNQFQQKIGGSTQKFVALGVIRKLLVAVPNIQEQNQIAGILKILDEKNTINRIIKIKLDQLKKGLMSDLLSGKVRTI